MFSIWACTFHLIGPWDKVHCPGGGLAQCLKLMNFGLGQKVAVHIGQSCELGIVPHECLK